MHLVTLVLDDDWLVGASPHVVHTFPNRVTPLSTTYTLDRGVGFVSSGHI